ncbi:MAG: hypothetical protein IKC65_05350 [Lentisphaeria bacterium]|nr:hypothetical protein [Lentisphaeria bacterium]
MRKLFFLFCFLSVPLLFSAMTELEKKEFWHKGPHLKLPHRSNRGISYAQVKRAARMKIPSPRKAPVAQLVYDGKIDRKGNLDHKKIPVELLEESGVGGNLSIRFGLPLPEGAVFHTRHIRLTDKDGREIPSQTAITGFWKDKSIKWALIHFSYPLKAREKCQVFAEFGNKVSAQKYAGLTFKEDQDKIIVDTGAITASVNKKHFNLVETITRNGKKLGGFSAEGVVVQDPVSGKDFTLSGGVPASFRISEKGPLRLTLRVAGKYRNGKDSFMDYVARVSFEAGSSAVDIELTHINTVLSREFTDIAKLDMIFQPEFSVTSPAVVLSSGKKLFPQKRIFQETDQFYTIDGSRRTAGRMTGAACLKDGDFSFGIAHAWQRYPKALSFEKNTIRFELLPRQNGEEFNRDLPYYLVYPFCDGMYRMKWGMSFTEKIRLDFSGSKRIGGDLTRPVIAVLPAGWYDETGVFPGLAAPGFQQIDKKITGSFKMRLKQQHAQREYGFFNYGDSFGEKGENWTNNEYDMAHGLFLSFLRTGNRAFFRSALEASRHQADVDICHAYPDSYYVGGNLNHGAGHTGRYKVWSFRYGYYQSAANGHTWTWGMINAWNLIGDAVSMDAALLSGDHIALAMAPHFQLGKNPQAPRECSWAIRAVGKMYDATLDPVYLEAMKTLARKSAAKAAESDNGVWSYQNPRLIKERGEKSFGNVIFITAVGLKGLCEYYLQTGDEAVRPVIKNVARQIAKAFDPTEGCGFYYDIRKDGKKLNYAVVYMNLTIVPALAEAAVILNDPALYDIARRGAAAGLLRAPGFSGKFLAEYLTFMTDFLAAHKKFPKKYQLDFKDLSMLKLALQGEQIWNMRAPNPGVYSVRLLRDGAFTLELERWLWPGRSRVKHPQAGITVADKNGKVLVSEKFDSSQGAFSRAFKLNGKKGDTFTVTIRDNGSGGWNIVPSRDFVHAGMAQKVPFHLTRCGMNRVYFEVPANRNTSVAFYGTHCGAFGYWLFDDNGKLLKSKYSWQPELSLSKKPLQEMMIRLPRNSRKKVYTLVFYAEFDARMRLNNLKCISGSRAWFL